MAGKRQLFGGEWANVVTYGGGSLYDSDTLTIANSTSDEDIEASAYTIFDTVEKAHYVEIRTDATITVKVNSDSNDGIVIASTDSPYIIDRLEVTNLYISNASGGAATVEVFVA